MFISITSDFMCPSNKKNMRRRSIAFARLTHVLIQIVKMEANFTHLQLCVAVARNNIKWVLFLINQI